MARSYLERSDLVPQLAEIFRRHGYEGASIGVIAKETGAGRSSLYHFFPGGKEEMADAVLAQISDWFEVHIFAPLRERPAQQALAEMAASVETYFRSGQRICLVGAFALDDVRSRFSERIESYFARWSEALAECLQRAGWPESAARQEAISILAAIQGGIVLTRASGNAEAFRTALSSALARAGAEAIGR
ncbi:TetR/AcrR family transcriptional regulator [Paenirhodobacter hankyongi]|uniref:TetR/AcrR family transcriptional regulator n=1 Tax=Paenirhodobacter hankyongi TaxID=2294033 RepID=A0A421BKM5_9RHOB|nr:TetR/AcrR family transcriptional regulator [Sinirhodobacter hankyongi]RLL62956.1 TetR/AcrR family transcriptional regulator [Sinirhodobacter hankyongi]